MTAHALSSDAPDHAAQSARGSSFFTAMRIMPSHQRSAMYEIYHFCRMVDDIADEAGAVDMRLKALQTWRHELAAIYAGNAPRHQEKLAQAINQFSLRHEDFLDVIVGMEMDVHGPIQAPDLTTLEQYCDRVACAVGRLSVRVFEMEESSGMLLAHHLGMALQLTNILRDIDEDAAIERIYLPREWLLEAGIPTGEVTTKLTRSEINAIVTHPNLPQVCARIATKAQDYFEQAEAIMQRSTRAKIRTPRVMAHAYHAIHTALVARGFASPRAPIKLNKGKLVLILARNLLF